MKTRVRKSQARWSRRRGAAGALVLPILMGLAIPSQAAAPEPRLDLRASSKTVTLERAKGRRVFLDLGVYLAVLEAPFDLQVKRPVYDQPIEVTQILRTSGAIVEERPLPGDVLDGWRGLSEFLNIKLTDREGKVVVDDNVTFCPNGYERQRVNDQGPVMPSYPGRCFDHPFTKGIPWGIDEGWATRLSPDGLGYRIPSGRYTATVSVTERFQTLFGIASEDASTTIDITIKTVEMHCRYCHGKGPYRNPASTSRGDVPTMDNPDSSQLPDLVSMPAWGMSVQQGRKRTRLTFGATVWVAGNADLVVEGFRREDESLMDAYQYFYEDGRPVGRSEVGAMEYDTRDGHGHWHFQQFARYSLLNADKTEILLSKKEAFCLAATDAVDLFLPGVDMDPNNQNLYSACGAPDALWIRETLPLGWGDTYFQGIPGQAFNITDLPNGTYHVLVEANPGGLLHEVSADNNIELREIQLKGRPDARRVVVPPWNGIDSETAMGGFGG